MSELKPCRPLRVQGVGRMADNDLAVLVMLSDNPSDDELRALHDYLRAWKLGQTWTSIAMPRASADAMREADKDTNMRSKRAGQIEAAQAIANYIEQSEWRAELQLVFDACMAIVCNPNAVSRAALEGK